MTNTHLTLINPPATVTAALAQLQHACAGWGPTEVPNASAPLPSAMPPPPQMEAAACHYLADPDAGPLTAFELGASVVLFLWFVIWMLRPHPILRWLASMAAVPFRRREVG